MAEIMQSLDTFLKGTGIYLLFAENPDWWKTALMFVIAGALVYLAIVKGFEPLLLLPIAIGMLLTNIPGAEIFHADWFVPNEELVALLDSVFKDEIFTFEELQLLLDKGIYFLLLLYLQMPTFLKYAKHHIL